MKFSLRVKKNVLKNLSMDKKKLPERLTKQIAAGVEQNQEAYSETLSTFRTTTN